MTCPVTLQHSAQLAQWVMIVSVPQMVPNIHTHRTKFFRIILPILTFYINCISLKWLTAVKNGNCIVLTRQGPIDTVTRKEGEFGTKTVRTDVNPRGKTRPKCQCF